MISLCLETNFSMRGQSRKMVDHHFILYPALNTIMCKLSCRSIPGLPLTIKTFFMFHLLTRVCTSTYQSRHCKISGMHLLSQPVNLSSRVQEDNSLGDCKGLVEVTQRVQLPLLQMSYKLALAENHHKVSSYINILIS